MRTVVLFVHGAGDGAVTSCIAAAIAAPDLDLEAALRDARRTLKHLLSTDAPGARGDTARR
jgi:hypothetical protein